MKHVLIVLSCSEVDVQVHYWSDVSRGFLASRFLLIQSVGLTSLQEVVAAEGGLPLNHHQGQIHPIETG